MFTYLIYGLFVNLFVYLWIINIITFYIFPNSEILFDFNEGSSGVFQDHLMFYLVRGALPGIVGTAPSTW